jgi:hypothetical protein
MTHRRTWKMLTPKIQASWCGLVPFGIFANFPRNFRYHNREPRTKNRRTKQMSRLKQISMKRKVRVPTFAVTALLTALPGLASTIITLPVATSGAECISVNGTVVDNTTSCSNGGGSANVTQSPFAEVSSSAVAGTGMS